MSALVRAELLRIRRTRATWGLLGAALGLTLALTATVLGEVGAVSAFPRGSTELRDVLLSCAGVGALPVVLLGVLAVTGEFHHRTASSTFLVTPSRGRVLVAKAVAGALTAVPVALVLMAAPLAAGAAVGAVALTPDLHLAGMGARGVAAFAGWGLLGVGLGAAIRNQSAAVAVPLLWFGVVEQMLPSYSLAWLLPWLPGGANAALSGARFAGALPAWAAAAVFLAYAVALLATGGRAIALRDVT